MKVKIRVEFVVEPADDSAEGFDESVAISAASTAAWDNLSLVEVSGYSSDTKWVTVHVDGFGECEVSIGEDHD